MFDEFEAQEHDQNILKAMKARKSKKTFDDIINKGRLDPFELDEVMA